MTNGLEPKGCPTPGACSCIPASPPGEGVVETLRAIIKAGTWTGSDEITYTSNECRIAREALSRLTQGGDAELDGDKTDYKAAFLTEHKAVDAIWKIVDPWASKDIDITVSTSDVVRMVQEMQAENARLNSAGLHRPHPTPGRGLTGAEQDGWFLDATLLNELQRASVSAFLEKAKRANEINVTIREDAIERTFECDWIKHFAASPSPNPNAGEDIRREENEACAKLVQHFPAQILRFWERPGSPPGNAYGASTRDDLVAAIRARLQPLSGKERT